jgi:hypothetical protein
VNDDECLALLVATDDPVNSVWPGGYDADAIRLREDRFKGFAADLEARLAVPCVTETGQLIQDASFVGSIALPAALCINGEAVQVRVSHFGPFVAVLDSDDAVTPETLSVIKSTATAHGYTWIPTNVLTKPYTGSNPGVTGFGN